MNLLFLTILKWKIDIYHPIVISDKYPIDSEL